MANQRERERVLGLDTGQADRGIENGIKGIAVGKFAGLGGDRAGDLLELIPARQIMFEHDKLALQLGRDLGHRGENHDDRTVLLASRDGCIQGLHDFHAAQEPVEVTQDQ